MTIPSKVYKCENLFHPNDCINFNRVDALRAGYSTPSLGSLTIVCGDPLRPCELETLDRSCAQEAECLLRTTPFLTVKDRLWLFAATYTWQYETVMVKYKRLWRHFDDDFDLSNFHKSDEFTFASREGVRYAGLARFELPELLTATSVLRHGPSCFIFISNRSELDSEENIRAMFRAAFPPRKGIEQGCVNWMTLALFMCAKGDVVVRVAGYYEEGQACIDFIMSPEKLPSLP